MQAGLPVDGEVVVRGAFGDYENEGVAIAIGFDRPRSDIVIGKGLDDGSAGLNEGDEFATIIEGAGEGPRNVGSISELGAEGGEVSYDHDALTGSEGAAGGEGEGHARGETGAGEVELTGANVHELEIFGEFILSGRVVGDFGNDEAGGVWKSDAAGLGDGDGVRADEITLPVEGFHGYGVDTRAEDEGEFPVIGGGPGLAQEGAGRDRNCLDIEPSGTRQGDGRFGGGEVVPAVGGDREIDRGHLGIDLAQDVVGAGIDVAEVVGEAVSADTGVEMSGPGSHPGLVVNGGADVEEVCEIGATIGLIRDNSIELGVLKNITVGVEGEILVVWEVENFAIRAPIELTVVVRVGVEGITGSSGARVGESTEPLIDIEHVGDAVIEVGGRLAELFAQRHRGQVVVEFLVVFDEIGPAVVLIVVAHVVDVATDDTIGLGNLVSAGVGRRGVVDELVFVDGALSSVVELIIEEDGAEAGHLKDGGAGVNGVGRYDVGEVVEFAGDPTGGGGHEVEEEFALADDLSFRAVDGDGAVDVAEELVGGESDIEADPVVGCARALGSFDADSGVVVSLPFAIDDGAREAAVTHEIAGRVHPGEIFRSHNDAEVIDASHGGGTAVLDFKHGT